MVYDGLVNPALMDHVRASAERVYAGKKRPPGGQALTQGEINRVLCEHARAGKRVVRLKGGDPLVFGRGAEECRELRNAGIRFEIVPGITAATGVTAYAGIPLTARNVASTVVFATGHEAAGKPSSDIDWEALARAGTVVLYMAWRTVADCCQRLMAAGRSAETPACAVYWGTTAAQKTVTSTLGELPGTIASAGLKPPVLVVVGEVVSMRSQLAWHEMRPLAGARVLVTRNVEQSRAFTGAITELGGEPVLMPVTRIAPAGDADRAVLDQVVAQLGAYDWILFTSANSVDRFFAELHARARDTRALGRALVACVGPATARAARAHGVVADVVPRHGNAEKLAGAVIAARKSPGGRAMQPADADSTSTRGRILLPRAAQGRDEAQIALRAAGFEVDVATVYHTEMVRSDDPTIRHGLSRLRAGDIDVMAFFAPSQVRALFDLLGPAAVEIVGSCRHVAAIGNTTKAALNRRGVDVHVVPSRPDAVVMAEELATFYHETQRAGRSDRARSNSEKA